MKVVLAGAALLLLVSCASDGSQVIEALEFKDGQSGCVRAQGTIATGTNPIAQGSLNVNIVKTQGEDPVPC